MGRRFGEEERLATHPPGGRFANREARLAPCQA
jgi:hypothetical protein